jgi:diguanylate cyclase (GGDEF)-like protein/PAS domain S-box-containing protein
VTNGTDIGNGALLAVENEVQLHAVANPLVLLDVMPVAVFVIDAAATILFANERSLAMVGYERCEVLGRSALDFIDARDAQFAASLLETGSEYDGAVMGPSRIRYLDRDGVSHFSQFWSHEAPPELGLAGYVVTLTPESVRDVLASAVTSVTSDEPLDRTLAAIAMSGRAMPLDGIGSILLVEPSAPTDQDKFRIVGEWPIAPGLINAYGTPWRRCLIRNESQDVLDAAFGDVDARTGAEMAMAKLPAAWVRPIADASGDVVAVFIVWRRLASVVSVNQEQHMDDAIRLAHLALEQDRHRRELEFAAHRDVLTGVGNRASLNDRMELTRLPSSVLFIDLDRFKAVNDTFGHAVGDEVIAQTGRRIAAAVRRGDDVYRTGGDEFIVVCDPDHVDERGLLVLADRITERLRAPFDCRDHRVRIGATIGIASGRPHPEVTRSLQDTILVADRAMYVAKDRGRGSVHHADLAN